MFGLTIKVTAVLLNIIVVQGNVFREEKYLQDENHMKHYKSIYSGFPETDYFQKSFMTDFDVNPELLNLKPRYDPRRFDYVNLGKNIPDWFQKLPNSHYREPAGSIPINPVDQSVPDHSYGQGSFGYPVRRKPGRNNGNVMCRNIKGLPTPESGCCGVQVTRNPVHQQHPGYPNKPWWPAFPGDRFRRSTDDHKPPNRMIRGGRATDLHQLPWTAHLVINPRLPGLHTPASCGGTIISSRYVVTAAHCLYNTFKDISQLEVFLAEYDTDTYPKDCIKRDGKKICIKNKVMKVEHAILHKDYNDTYLKNDIALLRLSADIPYTQFIRPICLPTADIEDLQEEDIIIAGWGLNGKTETHLKQAAFVKYVSNDKCKEQYSYKDDSLFCSIGDRGEDICQGDSGGPLMVVMNNQYFLSGIVNGKRKDLECGSSISSLFNNVFHHKDWIIKHVNEEIPSKRVSHNFLSKGSKPFDKKL